MDRHREFADRKFGTHVGDEVNGPHPAARLVGERGTSARDERMDV